MSHPTTDAGQRTMPPPAPAVPEHEPTTADPTENDLRSRLALAHLALLFPDPVGLVELRARHVRSGRWTQRFHAATDLDAVARQALRLAPDHEVYVGALPRTRPSGGSADLQPAGSTVWVDLDAPHATERVRVFEPAPSLLLSSGSPGHAHAYWALSRPLPVAQIEALNRALADQLGGDPASADGPRILRLAGTLAHKHEPPVVVAPLRSQDDRAGQHLGDGSGGGGGLGLVEAVGRASTTDLLDRLPEAASPKHSAPPGGECSRGSASSRTTGGETTSDHQGRAARERGSVRGPRAVGEGQRRLEALSPEAYVPVLTGLTVDAHRKVRCPLHEDRTPSLHVYPTAEEGWFCFGCRRGGTVYDLAAARWNRPVRGLGFLELRDDLLELLVPEARGH